MKHEIIANFDELYLLGFARLRADKSGLKGSAAHPANRGTKLNKPPHFAASPRRPKACTSVARLFKYIDEPIHKGASGTDIILLLSTLTAGAIVTRMGRDWQSQAWSSAAR